MCDQMKNGKMSNNMMNGMSEEEMKEMEHK